MLVHAQLGEKCPKEGHPREYITDDPAGVEVPDTAYYRRLTAEGSLVHITPASPVTKGDKNEVKTHG